MLAFTLVAATVHSDFNSGNQTRWSTELSFSGWATPGRALREAGHFYPFLWNSDNYLHSIISDKSLQLSEGLAILGGGIRLTAVDQCLSLADCFAAIAAGLVDHHKCQVCAKSGSLLMAPFGCAVGWRCVQLISLSPSHFRFQRQMKQSIDHFLMKTHSWFGTVLIFRHCPASQLACVHGRQPRLNDSPWSERPPRVVLDVKPRPVNSDTRRGFRRARARDI